MDELRRKQAWELLFRGRLSACYWQKVLSKLRRRRRIGSVLGALLLFGAALIGIKQNLSWVPSITAAAVGLLATIVGVYFIGSGAADAKAFSRAWIELRSDVEQLWEQGEHLNWSDDEVVIRLERLSERERNYQANELEDPDLAIVVECERALHQRLGVSFPEIPRED